MLSLTPWYLQMSTPSPEATDTAATLTQIEERLGFVPPFFLPAVAQPRLLDQLWRHTVSAYLDNPLPALFKEKLAAVVGRYCAVRYCLMCHTCTLRPLGMQGPEIARLLKEPSPTAASLQECARRSKDSLRHGNLDPAGWNDDVQADLICLSVAVYRGDALAEGARSSLAELLGTESYNYLISFISYNHMCHDWIEAHPEVSYELDQRYIQNYIPMVEDTAEIATLLDWNIDGSVPQPPAPSELVSEAMHMNILSEQRLREVLHDLKRRLSTAEINTVQEINLRSELQKTAVFAQEILAIVSHDLRNPITAIANAAAILTRNADENVARLGTMVKRSSERAAHLLGDLLDFSQARIGGGIPTHRQPANMHDVLAEIVATMKRSDPERTIEVATLGNGDGMWDRDRLHQAGVNLLVNALKHGPKESDVSVTSNSDELNVVIAITNQNKSGAIPADVMASMFEPFKRFSVESTNPGRSVGLGLYIVHQIVTGHGGSIHVRSEHSHTTFTMTLPRC